MGSHATTTEDVSEEGVAQKELNEVRNHVDFWSKHVAGMWNKSLRWEHAWHIEKASRRLVWLRHSEWGEVRSVR